MCGEKEKIKKFEPLSFLPKKSDGLEMMRKTNCISSVTIPNEQIFHCKKPSNSTIDNNLSGDIFGNS